MKLFTKEINNKLFKQYPEGNDLDNQMVAAKIFNPYGKGRWFLLNSDPQDPDYIWAIVQMGDIVEVGSVSRSELESIRVSPFKFPLERDLGFSMVNAGELLRGLEQGKFYKEGGSVAYAGGGMTAGRWYKDNSGEEYRYIGENHEGKLLFNDGNGIVVKDDSDFENAPKEKRRFGIFEVGGELKEDFLEDIKELHGEIAEITLVDGTKISHDELMAAHKMEHGGKADMDDCESYDKYDEGGEVINNKLNIEVKKMAIAKGLTPKELGRDYELTMAKATVAALTDANYHDEARKLVSILEKNPKIAEKPDYPNPSDPKFKEKMAEIKEVYGSEYFEADENTSAFARKVSQKADYDGVDVANAFEYVLKMNGFTPLANKIHKAMEEEMAEGGMMEHGLRIGDKVTTDMFWENKIVVDNVKTHKRAQIDLENGTRKDEMAEGGEIESEAQRLADNPNWTNEKLKAEYDSNSRDLRNFNNGLIKPSRIIGGGYKSSAVAKRLAKEWLEKNVAQYKKALEIRGVMAKGGEVDTYEVELSAESNPDYEKSSYEGSVNIKSHKVKAKSIENARDIVVAFIMENDLGSGNWSGGNVYKNGKKIGHVSYNGRYWDDTKMAKGGKLVGKQKNLDLNKNGKLDAEDFKMLRKDKMAMGGKVKFEDKVKAIKASLLKTKKVSPKVQKDYGKTYSAKEAELAAKRIAGAMRKKEMK